MRQQEEIATANALTALIVCTLIPLDGWVVQMAGTPLRMDTELSVSLRYLATTTGSLWIDKDNDTPHEDCFLDQGSEASIESDRSRPLVERDHRSSARRLLD